MAFKMSGFSAFTKNGDPPPQDPPSGRSQEDEIYHDIVNNKKEIRRFEKKGNTNAVNNLKRAMNANISAWEKLTGKKYGQGVFE